MKHLLVIIMSLGLLYQSSAQVIKVQPVFSVSSYQKFHSAFGYGIGYELLTKSNNKLSLTFSQCFNANDYSYIFSSGADGHDYYRDVSPQNQRLSFSTSYSFNLCDRPKSGFFAGPKIGINYFKINESILEREVNENVFHSKTYNYWENNKIGLGLILEYERNILSDKLSLSFSTEPELIFLTVPGLKGSSDPPVTAWLSFNLNIMFNLTKSRKTE